MQSLAPNIDGLELPSNYGIELKLENEKPFFMPLNHPPSLQMPLRKWICYLTKFNRVRGEFVRIREIRQDAHIRFTVEMGGYVSDIVFHMGEGRIQRRPRNARLVLEWIAAAEEMFDELGYAERENRLW